MNIVTQEMLEAYREESTRIITMPDGSERSVRMTPDLWAGLRFLKVVEGISSTELAGYALEEMQLQSETFDRAFRGVVAYLMNRWT